jgi:hypothetical protein
MARAEVPGTSDLAPLAPAFRIKVITVLAELTEQGFDAVVAESIRTPERQASIFGKGRTVAQVVAAGLDAKYAWPDNPDGICTNAASHLFSVHGHGLAVDVVSKSKQWNAPQAFWNALGAAAQKHGLTWGGTWKRPHDVPHIQWPLKRNGVVYAGPNEADRTRSRVHGIQETWRFYGALTPAAAKAA